MRTKLALVVLLLAALPLSAQRRHHDPLTEAEADQMRDVAQEPEKRLKLIIRFANARMQAIQQLRGDPKMAQGRGKQVHDLLSDFTELVDELDDNVNMYATRKQDLSKALGDVIVADSDWQLKLRAIKEEASSAAEAKDYQFVLDNAIDSVNSNADNARDLLDEIAKEKAEEKKKGAKDKDKKD
jgi:hypothetical protein